jgi:uncharacterized membrane protein YfcA
MIPTVGVLLALALAVLIGLTLGALGGGGSILTLPLLVHVAGIDTHAAVEMSIAIVGGTSLVGAYLHFRRGQVHRRAVLLFAVAGGIGAYFGSQLTHRVSSHVLMLIFAALMFSVGVVMLKAPQERVPGRKCRPVRCLLVGMVVGLLTGFLGVGGGFLIVPALVVMAGIETRKAMGSSLAIISLNSISGFVGHLNYAALDPKLTLGFLALALLGMRLGMGVADRVSDRRLQQAFAWLVLGMSVAVTLMNLGPLLAGAA